MPLRDHFRPPLDNMRHWESFLAGWPAASALTARPSGQQVQNRAED